LLVLAAYAFSRWQNARHAARDRLRVLTGGERALPMRLVRFTGVQQMRRNLP